MIGTQSVCRAEACDQLSVSGIKIETAVMIGGVGTAHLWC